MSFIPNASSYSSLFLDPLPLCSSLSPSTRRVSNFIYPFKLCAHSSESKYCHPVSVQDSVPHKTQDAISSEPPISQYPNRKTSSSSTKYSWVNPNSPRAARLRKQSYGARYDALVRVALSLNSCNLTEDDVFGILSSLDHKITCHDAVNFLNNMSNAENAMLALMFFQQKVKTERDVVLYNVTLKVFRRCKDMGSAEKLFDEMLNRGVNPDNVTFSTLISCARICWLPHKAVEWFEKMSEYRCVPDDITYSAMIDAYGRAGNVDMALSLYDRARAERWRIDAVTFATLIKIYGMSGNFDGCLNVYEEMKALGVKPNLVLYNTLLDSMGRAKRPWHAKIIYQEMIENGFSPNSGTYCAMLRAFSRARYGEDALDVYKQVKEKGIELNVILYNTLLAMCAELGYTNEAFEIFEDMKSSEICKPDSWTFSSLITITSCDGKVSETEAIFNEMLEAGFEPNIFVLTSLIQCYGKANRTDDVVRTFTRLLDLGITPDDRFCGCLLNVMTQTPREELCKLAGCIEKANSKLGCVVKLLIAQQDDEGSFRMEVTELFDSIGADVKKAYCNCLIDLCVSLNLLERARELVDLALKLEVYKNLQSRSASQWSLHLKSLSRGAALTALHVWISDVAKAMKSPEELPPMLGINTGHGKHKYSEDGLAGIFESHLKELNAPFQKDTDKPGWFFTTNIELHSWLNSIGPSELLTAKMLQS